MKIINFILNDFESSERLAQIYSQHFEQAITILIDNAVKYSPVNKEIQVTIKALEDEMLVQVQDNGEGISKEDINHIFERFYRSDKARTVQQLNLVLVLVCQSFIKLWKLIAAVLMLVLNLVLEHVSTFIIPLCRSRNDDTST